MFLEVVKVLETDATQIWGLWQQVSKRTICGTGVIPEGVGEVASDSERSSISSSTYTDVLAMSENSGDRGEANLSPPSIDYPQVVIMMNRSFVKLFEA
jgi:hypothetical protein